MKQVLGPALVLVVVWLLYVAGGFNLHTLIKVEPKEPELQVEEG